MFTKGGSLYKSGTTESDWIQLATLAYLKQSNEEVDDDGDVEFVYMHCMDTFLKPANTRLIATTDAAKKGLYLSAANKLC